MNKPNYLPSSRPPKYNPKFKFQCMVCLKGFKTEQGIKDHVNAKRHEPIVIRLKKNGIF